MKIRLKRRKYNVRYIVVHTTGTRADRTFKELDKLPYHYVITPSGRLINLKPLQPKDGTIEIALLGGLNRWGIHADTCTGPQEDTLFNTLILLTEAYPEAQIAGADEMYAYGFANPGFNVREWISEYIPAFLQVA